jgi:hypothetical protein
MQFAMASQPRFRQPAVSISSNRSSGPATTEGQTMDGRKSMWRRAAAAVGIALGLAAGIAQASWYESSFVKGRLVQVDVYDRASGAALPVYANNGRNYIEGAPGHEYGVRIRNCTGARVLVVTSVDGVNVISGDTAAPSQSGYVLEPWGYVVITGWRKSMDRTAAFYFTDLGDSYAARTGRPQNVGVVGVAVFQEKAQPISSYDYRKRIDMPVPLSEAKPAAAPPMARQEAAGSDGAANESRARDSLESAAKTLGKLGTGHGRSEDSRVTQVAFERATDSPAETLAIQYDRHENLVAMGVLPPPHYARRNPPDPFPGTLRFAPDPR